jgi:hypothetical protein
MESTYSEEAEREDYHHAEQTCRCGLFIRVVPRRFKHHPGVILGVLISTCEENGPSPKSRNNDATTASSPDNIIESLRVIQPLTTTINSDENASMSPTTESTKRRRGCTEVDTCSGYKEWSDGSTG